MLAFLYNSRAARITVRAYLELPHNWLAIVFGSHVCTQSYQITAIDMFLSEAAFTILQAGCAFPLQASGLSFLLGLSVLEWYILAALALS